MITKKLLLASAALVMLGGWSLTQASGQGSIAPAVPGPKFGTSIDDARAVDATPALPALDPVIKAKADALFDDDSEVGETRALWAHGHGAAFYGVVAALVPEFAWVVGGTAVTEVVFALPGLSQFLVQSIGARDYFVLQAYVVLVACWMLLVRLAVDVILHRLEPRLR